MSAEWDNSSAEPDPTLRPERLAEDGDKALRPKGLNEFIGQEAARANLSVFINRQGSVGRPWTMRFFMARPILAKPLWRKSWRVNWV